MKNQGLENLLEEMVDNHAGFIRGYAELIRRAYRLGRTDERMDLPDQDLPNNKQLAYELRERKS